MAKFFEVNDRGMEFRLAARDALGVPQFVLDQDGKPVDFRPEIIACGTQDAMNALTGRIKRAVEKREGPVRQFVTAKHHETRPDGVQGSPAHKSPKDWARENMTVDPPWYFEAAPGREGSWFDRNWRDRQGDGKYRFEIKWPKDAERFHRTADQDAAQRKAYSNVDLGEPYDPEKRRNPQAEAYRDAAKMERQYEDALKQNEEVTAFFTDVNYADIEARIIAAFGIDVLGKNMQDSIDQLYGRRVSPDEFKGELKTSEPEVRNPKRDPGHPTSPRKGKHNRSVPNRNWKKK